MKPQIALFLLGTIALWAAPARALQVLDDTALSTTTGQDGVDITITPNAGKVAFSSIDYTDTDGFATTINGTAYTGPAALVASTSTGSGIEFCTNTTGACTPTTTPIVLSIDADGSTGRGGTPMLSTSISLPSTMNRMRIGLASLGLRADTQTGGVITRGTTVVPLVNFSNGIEVVFGATPKVNLILGNESASDADRNNFLNLTSMNIASIDLGTVSLVSNGAAASNSTLSLGAKITNLDLSGADIDVTASGLTLSKASLGKFNVTLTDITAGQAGNQAAGVFNNLKNGSMGSIGVMGVQITNPRFTVAGL